MRPGDGGLATSALIYGPTNLFEDRKGNIFIADRTNNKLRVISKDSGLMWTAAGNAFISLSLSMLTFIFVLASRPKALD